MAREMELQKEKERQGCKMFIGGLTLRTTKETLEEYYSHWGEVIDAVVMKDPQTSRPRGFGFITYTSPESVERCLGAGPHEIDERIVETKRAVPREETRQEPESSSKSKKVFLGGLSLDTTERDIMEAVRHFGEIDEVFLIAEKDTNKPRGFGFVTFMDCESANKLCSQRYIRISERDVEAKKAISLDSMKRQGPSRPPRRSEMPDRSHRSHGSSSRDHSYIPPPPQSYQQPSYHHSQPQYGGQYSDYPPQAYRDEYYNNGGGYRGVGGGGGGGPPSYRPPYNSGSGGYGGGGGAGPVAYGGYSYNGGPGGYRVGGGGGGGYPGYPRGGEISAQSGRGGGGGGGYRSQGGAASRSYHPYRRPCVVTQPFAHVTEMDKLEFQREKERQGCKMFIGGLTMSATKDKLERYYGQWGMIIDAAVVTDPQTRRSRGFGFVTYNSRESVDKCLAAGPHYIDERLVETKKAVPREEAQKETDPSSKSKKVFLGGLHLDTTKEELMEAAKHIGEIDEVSLIIDPEKNKPRGFGFITFMDYESAEKLCNQGILRVRDRDVETKKAVSIESMRQNPTKPKRNTHSSSSRDLQYVPPPYQQSTDHDQYGGQYNDYEGESYDDYYDRGGYRWEEPSPYRPHYRSVAYGGYSYYGGPGVYRGRGGGGGGYPGYPKGGGEGGGYPGYSRGGGGGYRSQGGAASHSYHPYRRPSSFK